MKIRFFVASLCVLCFAASTFAQQGPANLRAAGFSVNKFPFHMNEEIVLTVNGTLTHPLVDFPTAKPMRGAQQCWFHGGYTTIRGTDTNRWQGVQGGWRDNPPHCRFTARAGSPDIWDLRMTPSRFFPNLPPGTVIMALNFVVNDGPGGERSGGMPMPAPDPNNRDGRVDVYFPMVAPQVSVRNSDEYVEAVSASPNPSSSIVQIGYGMRQPGATTVKIFNSMGNEVKTLVENPTHPQGYHVAIWEGDDNSGNLVPSGVYLYRVEVNGTIKTGKIVLNR
ncbi:MAG: FlgD immunoglobulin-like domain containing protein [Bacteroidota bacterium]|nr:T9SS type A sorting domain-containing protein [Candidatus Kapabacteria bacterium]MDW8219781.1 FlgD immunoglobulin-like domain containing protein [Bacteroidota bacterium]